MNANFPGINCASEHSVLYVDRPQSWMRKINNRLIIYTVAALARRNPKPLLFSLLLVLPVLLSHNILYIILTLSTSCIYSRRHFSPTSICVLYFNIFHSANNYFIFIIHFNCRYAHHIIIILGNRPMKTNESICLQPPKILISHVNDQ